LVPAAAAASFKRESALEAIKKAAELMGAGLANVAIIDEHGRKYSADEFAQLYRDSKA
jgi:hypothetical protein